MMSSKTLGLTDAATQGFMAAVSMIASAPANTVSAPAPAPVRADGPIMPIV